MFKSKPVIVEAKHKHDWKELDIQLPVAIEGVFIKYMPYPNMMQWCEDGGSLRYPVNGDLGKYETLVPRSAYNG